MDPAQNTPAPRSGFDQAGFRVRLEWGPNGLRQLAPVSDVIVIIDVLSFTTAVELIVTAGGIVHPYRWHDGSEAEFAASVGARLARRSLQRHDADGDRLYSLSPETLVDFPRGEAIVLPSPNGSALSHAALEAGASHVLAGCLRNATAVGQAADVLAGPNGVIGIVPAGERWHGTTGPMRVAWEDLLGAGAIAHAAEARTRATASAEAGRLSPEARAAMAAFTDARGDLLEIMRDTGSGREHHARGTPGNVELAADLDVSAVVPVLRNGTYVAA